jgi:hypothetical protein
MVPPWLKIDHAPGIFAIEKALVVDVLLPQILSARKLEAQPYGWSWWV